jgi:hypothetical protein
MPRFLKAVTIFLLTASVPAGLAAQTSNLSKAAGRYVAGAYQGITNSVIGGPYATGTVNIQLAHPWIETPDGRTIYPYSTSLPVTIFNSSGSETLTPSAVSNCSSNSPAPCTIAVTASNAHGQGDYVMSGTGGLYEAAYDANANGGGVVVVDPSSGATATNVTNARALYANVGIEDEKTAANGIASPSVLLTAVGTGTATASSTLFLLAAGAATNAFTNTTATNATFIAPRTGTLRNSQCTATTGGVNASSGAVTVRSAAVSSGTFSNTTLTATFGTGTTANDTTHTANVTLGQPLQIQVTSQAAETLAGVVCTLQLN